MRVGERLACARKQRSLSQNEVGLRLNPPRGHAAVSDIERGKTTVSLGLIGQFASIYGVSRDWLLDEWLWEGGEE